MGNNSSTDDVVLMQRIARCDAEAFCILVDRHSKHALLLAARMMGDARMAEDVVQEAFEAVWRGAAAWRPLAQFSTWFYRVICNIANRKRRDVSYDGGEPDEIWPMTTTPPSRA